MSVSHWGCVKGTCQCQLVMWAVEWLNVLHSVSCISALFQRDCVASWCRTGPVTYHECTGHISDLAIHPLTSSRHHLSYDDCLENKGRLQDYSCSIGSYHCIQCYAHILWAAPTGQTDLPLSHWVHFTVLRCTCVFVFSCISLHACCIIVTRWGGPGGIEAWSDEWPYSFSALTLLVGSHDL